MLNKTGSILVIGVVLLLSLTASTEAMVISSFDSDLDGWVANTPAETSWASTGGNPGGYYRFVDSSPNGTWASAPSKFLGDWSGANGTGQITFDQKIFRTGSGTFAPYKVTISGSGGAARWQGATATGATDWVSQSLFLNESDWAVIAGSWAALLPSVDMFKVDFEKVITTSLPGEIVGTDNIALSFTPGANVIPEPSTMLLFGTGLLGAFCRRRTT